MSEKKLKQMQAIVDEIRDVCRKHGVVLIGTDDDQDKYGEITIGSIKDLKLAYRDVASVVNNEVEVDRGGFYHVRGIGSNITVTTEDTNDARGDISSGS